MKWVGSHGSLSLLFVMKVTVWHFLSNSNKVMTALPLIMFKLLWRFLCNFIDICSIGYIYRPRFEILWEKLQLRVPCSSLCILLL
jgi:hypothetical protein